MNRTFFEIHILITYKISKDIYCNYFCFFSFPDSIWTFSFFQNQCNTQWMIFQRKKPSMQINYFFISIAIIFYYNSNSLNEFKIGNSPILAMFRFFRNAKSLNEKTQRAKGWFLQYSIALHRKNAHLLHPNFNSLYFFIRSYFILCIEPRLVLSSALWCKKSSSLMFLFSQFLFK